jgi:non-homologous end joining protein Ku
MARPIIPFTSVRHRSERALRKLIAFDDDTFDKLTQLGRDRMATIQDLADEAFADLLKKHNIPVDLKDALRKSARSSKTATPNKAPKKSVTSSRKTSNARSKTRKAAA